MSDHVRDASSQSQQEVLRSFIYPWAAAPDIIRAHQKDAYFQSVLLQQLSTVIRSLYGARTAHTWNSEARTFTELLYLGLTTFVGNRTLGEEYCDIVQVEDDTQRLPSIARRAGYIISVVLLPYSLSRLLPAFRKRLRSKLEASLRRTQRQRQQQGKTPLTSSTTLGFRVQAYVLKHLDTLTSPSLLYALSLATFYFTGAYYEISKRLLGLRYVFTRRIDPSDQRVGYEVLGFLLVLQMAVQGYAHIQDTIREASSLSPATSNPSSLASAGDDENTTAEPSFSSPLLFDATPATDPASMRVHVSKLSNTPLPPQDASAQQANTAHYDLEDPQVMRWIDGSQQRKCTLCLEAMKDPSATTCGHVFCWTCVTDWLREQPMCPLCRQSALVQHVLPLRG